LALNTHPRLEPRLRKE